MSPEMYTVNVQIDGDFSVMVEGKKFGFCAYSPIFWTREEAGQFAEFVNHMKGSDASVVVPIEYAQGSSCPVEARPQPKRLGFFEWWRCSWTP